MRITCPSQSNAHFNTFSQLPLLDIYLLRYVDDLLKIHSYGLNVRSVIFQAMVFITLHLSRFMNTPTFLTSSCKTLKTA